MATLTAAAVSSPEHVTKLEATWSAGNLEDTTCDVAAIEEANSQVTSLALQAIDVRCSV